MEISASLAVLFAGRRSAPAVSLVLFAVVFLASLTTASAEQYTTYTNSISNLRVASIRKSLPIKHL
jgi:hypothetical protein